MNWRDYIVTDNDILIGKPIIKGTRISVELILELLANGWTEQVILDSYPELSSHHIKAIFAYLKECLEMEAHFPLPKTA